MFAFYARVATIVGAFLAGLALAESPGWCVRNLTRGLTELLVPFFSLELASTLTWGFSVAVDDSDGAGDPRRGNRGKNQLLQSGDDLEGVAKLVARRYWNGSRSGVAMVAAQLGLSRS